MEDTLRYPIGKFIPQSSYSTQEIEANINHIETLPQKVDKVFQVLTPAQLETPYRPDGWTARQVIHHIADSHMNAYIRFKWTLTENMPTIKAYDEKAWAITPETNADPGLSIALLKALHAKWVVLLKSLSTENLGKSFIHPETGKQLRLDHMIALYAWHGDHHVGHLKIIQEN